MSEQLAQDIMNLFECKCMFNYTDRTVKAWLSRLEKYPYENVKQAIDAEIKKGGFLDIANIEKNIPPKGMSGEALDRASRGY